MESKNHRIVTKAEFYGNGEFLFGADVELEMKQQFHDVTRFGDTSQRLAPGLMTWSVAVRGIRARDFARHMTQGTALEIRLSDGRKGLCIVVQVGDNSAQLRVNGPLQ